MKVLKIVFVITFAALFTVACGSPSDNSNKPATANVSKPASDGAIVVNSNTAPAEKLEGGNSSLGAPKKETPATDDTAKIFADKCAMCHGDDGKGKTKGTPDLTNAEWQKKETDAEFMETIKAGKKPMPAFGGKLSDEQIKSLVAYVRGLAKK